MDANAYILHRLKIAGSSRMVTFTKGALRNIYRFSAGYPRLLNVICDRALLAGFSERSRFITGKMVRKAVGGLRGRGKRTKIRFAVSMKVVLPIAALVAIMALAIVLMWPYRADIPQIIRNFEDALSQAGRVEKASEANGPTPTEEVPPARQEETKSETTAESLEPTLAPEPEPSSQPGDPRNYILQVHSLKTQRQADAAVVDLENKGFPTLLSLEEGRDMKDWYVVFVGPYADLAIAREQAMILQGRESLSPIIRLRASVQQ
jgi:general secretion pathway protein A